MLITICFYNKKISFSHNSIMEDKLKTYKNKRDFNKTNEPKGKKRKSNPKKLNYSLQFHEASKDHFDLRLEFDGILLSWAIPKGPSLNPKDKRLAVKVEDHPFDYLLFEGDIPKGQYGGGKVTLSDSGFWIPLNDVKKSLKAGNLKFIIKGEKLKGQFALIKMKENNWLLIKEQDKYCKKTSLIKNIKKSILKNKEIKNPFHKENVQLATLKEDVPIGKDWIYELKYDGYRIIAEIEKNNVNLYTRNYQNYTKKFETIASNLKKYFKNKTLILDGEIIYIDEYGKSNFSLLQQALKSKDDTFLCYMVFDILAYEGNDLRNKTLIERKKILDKILKNSPENIKCSKYIYDKGKELFQKVKELNLEGIIAKKINSYYVGKRTDSWIKIKCRKSDEFIIGGYELSQKKNKQIKALYLGKYINNNLIYIGKVGTGFNQENSLELISEFKTNKINQSPFYDADFKDINFLKPSFLAEVEYSEFTSSNKIRQASFKTLRKDKSIDDLETITITNPNRIVFSKNKITKEDIFDYYKKVAAKMLPYIINRPLSVLRCNKNVFLKRHPDKEKEGIVIFDLKDKNSNKKQYFAILNEMGIYNEVQYGSIEFHICNFEYQKINTPDYLIFDLDPDEELSLDKLKLGVKKVKLELKKINLQAFLKTSGNKGYHIIVPFNEVKNWDVLTSFAHNFALMMENKYPNLFITNMNKIKRKDKIFIDYLRNKKGSTCVAPYSLRAKKEGAISFPISWKDLETINPSDCNIFNVDKMLKKNSWKNFFAVKKKQNLL